MPAMMVGNSLRTPLTTDNVEASPLVRIGRSAECRPSRRTRFVCGLNPSWTKPTSRTYTSAPFTYWIGMSFSSSRRAGLLLIPMSYSIGPILAVPGVTMVFCRKVALSTSWADRPRA